jgi:SSS family solute:Na+ symporter
MDFFMLLDVGVFIAFVACVLVVGIGMSRGEKTSEEYFLAGRGLTWWLIGFSLIAANISAEQFVGMSGQAAKRDIGLAVASYEWIAAITLVIVAFFFLPTFLRSGIYTIPEFLEYRFNRAARTIMSLLMVIVYVAVTISTVTYLGAKALQPIFPETVLGFDVNIASLSWLVGIVAALYVASGGLAACAWADLIQGSALIIGGAIIMILALMALDRPQDFSGTDPAAVSASLGVDQSATLTEKFEVLKDRQMHMVLPSSSTFLPWTALLLGIWIPNLYYWGLNQYIMQRTLGASSLAAGQKGVVFAAGLKLIIPFIVCIPGVIASTLYHQKMQENAQTGIKLNAPVLEEFDKVETDPQAAKVVFPFDRDFAALYPEHSERIFRFNARVAGVDAATAPDAAALRDRVISFLKEKDPTFASKAGQPEFEPASLDLTELNSDLVTVASGELVPAWRRLFDKNPSDITKQQELIGYDFDSAFPMLIRYLTPPGLRGFVLAALMGAVISSLAAMFNAASTIFTMDIYREYLHRTATQRNLVWVGRFCVLLCMIIGCLIAPELAKPKWKGAFAFIQEFQGYISPGVLSIFLFGLFVHKTPRMAGVVGLVLSPLVYGYLHWFWSDIAFLNRMAITVGVLMGVLALMTLANPLPQPVSLPEQSKIELEGSSGAKLWGAIVIAATLALYWAFW